MARQTIGRAWNRAVSALFLFVIKVRIINEQANSEDIIQSRRMIFFSTANKHTRTISDHGCIVAQKHDFFSYFSMAIGIRPKSYDYGGKCQEKNRFRHYSQGT